MGTYLKGYAVIATVGTLAEQAALASINSQLNLTANTQDVTTKEDVSDGVLYPNNEVQYISATLQVDGFQKVSADALGTLDIGSEVACEFETGLRTYLFDGVITELNWTGNKDDVAGYSMTIQSKGEITKSTTSSTSSGSTT